MAVSVFYNGRILTCDPGRPRAEAVAIEGGRIALVGDLAEIRSSIPEGARLVDLGGRTMVPGFNDNHVHAFGMGVMAELLNLYGRSGEEIAAMVRDRAASLRPGELILGHDWDYGPCPEPHRSLLDAAAPRNPVLLLQCSGHGAWLNSRLMEELGLSRRSKDGPGSRIFRDAEGEPTGVVAGGAITSRALFGKYLWRLLPYLFGDAAILRALDRFAESGITSVQDNTWEPFSVARLRRLRKRGALSCRFSCWPRGETALRLLFDLFSGLRPGDPWLGRGPEKYFADGAFAPRSAWMTLPYAGEDGNCGLPTHSKERLEAIVKSAARRRARIAFHAIGDRAVHEVLDAVEKAQAAYPWTEKLRFRLEHVQIILPGDAARMRDLGVLVAAQPIALFSPDRDLRLLGPERVAHAYPYAELLDAGVRLSFGSDAPGEIDHRPLLGIYHAVTRMSANGREGPLSPEQAISPERALACYTMGSAYAECAEGAKGSIAEGKLADLAILSDDPCSIAPERIKDIRVLATIVDGRCVYGTYE
jgi:predicted amidohydrolase YtcJ